ncbi:hypothetical protein D8S78_00280 [Natrialba swarupiae]|nr:hypothetical protein [Natrialba swarupiae]
MGEETAAFGPNAESLIELDDVKPGDSGEVTFSLHVCDNPAYIWMGRPVSTPRASSGVRPRTRSARPRLSERGRRIRRHRRLRRGRRRGGHFNEVLAALADAAYQGVALTTEDGDACFDPIADSTCVAFEWWFPIGQENVNDAQGESVSFDVGFYAEQCRHNDQNVA